MRNALLFRSICSFIYPFNEGHGCLASRSDSVYNSYPHGCPCGYYGDPVKECSCSAMAIARYQKKISGPLLDRIDIHVEVPRVDYEKLADKRQVEDSKTIRARVQAARERQLERFKGTSLCSFKESYVSSYHCYYARDHSAGYCTLYWEFGRLRVGERAGEQQKQ